MNATEKITDTKAEATSAEQEGFFGDLTLVQVIAMAVGGAASFALSEQIGVAGSLIGGAIGTATTIVTAQIFKGIVKESAHKLEQLSPDSVPPYLKKAQAQQRRSVVAMGVLMSALCAIFVYTAFASSSTAATDVVSIAQDTVALAEEVKPELKQESTQAQSEPSSPTIIVVTQEAPEATSTEEEETEPTPQAAETAAIPVPEETAQAEEPSTDEVTEEESVDEPPVEEEAVEVMAE